MFILTIITVNTKKIKNYSTFSNASFANKLKILQENGTLKNI